MANPTTNYGFVLPTPTDLVTDLPADFDVALQGVDTQMLTNANAAIAKTIVDAKGDIIAATAADAVSRLAVGANNTVLTADSTTATGLKWAAGAQKVIQMVTTQTGAVATGTGVIPLDDTIPQNTEGDQYMSLTMTPTNASNDLLIQVVFNSATSSTVLCGVALFQDSIANALASTAKEHSAVNMVFPCAFTHKMTAGTISATTFKVRSGGNGSTTSTFNGRTSARLYGGTMASSITVWEVTP